LSSGSSRKARWIRNDQINILLLIEIGHISFQIGLAGQFPDQNRSLLKPSASISNPRVGFPLETLQWFGQLIENSLDLVSAKRNAKFFWYQKRRKISSLNRFYFWHHSIQFIGLNSMIKNSFDWGGLDFLVWFIGVHDFFGNRFL